MKTQPIPSVTQNETPLLKSPESELYVTKAVLQIRQRNGFMVLRKSMSSFVFYDQ